MKLRLVIILFFWAGLSVFVLAGCGSSPAVDGPGTGQGDLPVMGIIDVPISVDGLAEGYPEPPLQMDGVEVHLAYDGSVIYVHARAQADGWVAVGFNRRGGAMAGANIVLGSVDENGDTLVRNDLGKLMSHDQAAQDGLLEAIVVRDGEYLNLEFSYPAQFPEENGFNLDGLHPGGIYSLIVAFHTRSSNITQQHTSRGKADFQVEPGR